MIIKINAQETLEGDGVVVNRLFPISGRMNFDPFVLWDHFNIATGQGFPDHPHRGFEAVTYMLEGGMHHRDNLGNDSFISKGGVQVFCAGSGIVHSEMPAKKAPSVGIQLWVNLPNHLKKINPSYQEVLAEDFVTVSFQGGDYRTIVGAGSVVKLHTDITYQHFNLNKDRHYQLPIDHGLQVIVYVLLGSVMIDGHQASSTQALLIDSQKRQNLLIKAKSDSAFMVCSGTPHKEPIYQHGPYVD
jgi:redox-sensitive bicupin YhaK (pirin superfamily)